MVSALGLRRARSLFSQAGRRSLYARILRSAPLAYWPLNEPGGAACLDHGGRGFHGAYAGGAAPGQAGVGDGLSAAFFDGSGARANVYADALRDAWTPASTSLLCWCRVSGAGVWGDGQYRHAFRLSGGSSDILTHYKRLGALRGSYTAGGTLRYVSYTTSSTAWFSILLTVDKAGDACKLYINGAYTGAAAAGLGAWKAPPVCDNAVIGAYDASGGQPWSGWLAHVALWNRALTAVEAAQVGRL